MAKFLARRHVIVTIVTTPHNSAYCPSCILSRPNPSCILSDEYVFWTAKTAEKFQVPWIIFDGMSCFTKLCTELLSASKVHDSVSDSDPFVVPGLPDPIEFTKPQLPGLFNPGSNPPSMTNLHKQIRESEVGAYGVVINSFEELEKSYVSEFKRLRRDKKKSKGVCTEGN